MPAPILEPDFSIWKSYADFFCPKFKLKPEELWTMGEKCREIIREDARYLRNEIYNKTHLPLIRGIVFGLYALPARKKFLDRAFTEGLVKEPLADFGGGAGVLLRYAQEQYGFETCWLIESAGAQRTMMEDYGLKYDLRVTSYESVKYSRFGTILTTNTLEHIEQPMPVVHYLEDHCDQLLGSIDIGSEDEDDPCHIATREQRFEVERYMKEKGQWLPI